MNPSSFNSRSASMLSLSRLNSCIFSIFVAMSTFVHFHNTIKFDMFFIIIIVMMTTTCGVSGRNIPRDSKI
uniref:Uncharacterized protein n=1 Tax=Solanum tuberosum TaxID=4113 RepID=M1CD31_SOLTU